MELFVYIQNLLAIFIASFAISFAESFVLFKSAIAADCAIGLPDPILITPSSGSITSPFAYQLEVTMEGEDFESISDQLYGKFNFSQSKFTTYNLIRSKIV